MPELAPYVSDEETWRERRALYAELFRKPETFLFLARERGELVGYALGHILGPAESWWSDTWRTGERVGELESISVLPEHRGAGIGSALLDAVDAEFARLGVDDQVIGVLPGNIDAIRLYERRGSDRRGFTCPGLPVASVRVKDPGRDPSTTPLR
jgi:ribosomal protein S18 acetylase RimI-like enzyme